MKLSIIVPVYNIPNKLLQQCIESLLAQTQTDIEFIFINDCSPNPANREILRKYATQNKRIHFVDLEKNGGVSRARNKGLEVATGEYIGFVDADDYVDKEMFHKLFETAKQTAADVVECNSRFFLDQTNLNYVNSTLPPHVWCSDNISDQLKVIQSPTNGCCDKIYRREIIGQTTFIPEYTNYEDVIFNWTVLPKCKKIVSIPDILYYIVYRPESASRSTTDLKKFGNIFKSLQKLFDIATELQGRYPKLSRYLIIYVLNLGLVNRELLQNLHIADETTAYEFARTHAQQYIQSPLVPFELRLLLKIRIKKAGGFLKFPTLLYYILKISIKIHTRLLKRK